MPVQKRYRFLLAYTGCFLLACNGRQPELQIDRVAVVPVSGNLTVDGSPQADIIVRCVPDGAFEPANLAMSLGGRTDGEGNFTLGTYEIADGVPPGEYRLTFLWPPVALKKQSRAEEEKHDLLKGKYLDPQQSPVKLSVIDGLPIVLETVDLTTK